MSKNSKNEKRAALKSAERSKPTAGPVVPQRSGRRFYVVATVITLAALGYWGYLKWVSRNLVQQAETVPGPDVTTANPEIKTAHNSQPAWNRPCDNSTCGWVTDNEQSDLWSKIDNAANDGWDTEVFSSAAMKQFDKLKKVLIHGPFEASEVEFIVDPSAVVQRLLPANLTTTFQDTEISVRRAVPGQPGLEASGETLSGAQGLAQSLKELIASYNDPEKLRIKIKVFRVEKEADSIKTSQTVEVFGPTESGVKEINSIWIAHWTNDLEHPVMKAIRVEEYEAADRVGKTIYSECTESVLGNNASFRNQLLRGYNYWLDQSQFQRFFDLLGAPGVAVGDVNADGLEDMYICQEGGLPNLLYLQKPDGSLEDFSKQSGADWLQNSRCALIVDLNNDGHRDLVVGVDGGVVIAQGDSTGKFAIRKVVDTSDDVLSLSGVDYDLDGRLDLYVGAYYTNDYSGEAEQQTISTPGFIYYDARNGAPNSLLRNETAGDQWAFIDVTQEVGLNQNNDRFTLAAAWDDVDNDGDQDLYVANDFAANNLYRNDLRPDGTRFFVDVAREADAEDTSSGMSVAWGDYDRDGWMDIYVSNMFSYAGNRIMFQDRFKSDVDENVKKLFQRFARGNTLMKNLGKSDPTKVQKFEDQSLQAAVNRGRWAWGSSFVDINNDGWEDIVVANGYITTEDTGDL